MIGALLAACNDAKFNCNAESICAAPPDNEAAPGQAGQRPGLNTEPKILVFINQ